jgi:formate hydrogenlyase subunit 6/NADH:ubiquinone oxidoreductase subunit I
LSANVYSQLAHFLDNLPGGFPPTESGIELKILERLFTPEEAELAMHLALLAEPARVIAHRARKPVHDVAEMLDQMEKKGLVYARHKQGREPQYTATHFVVGIYEFQLNKMDEEIAKLYEQYLPHLLDFDVWKDAPQIRTIPVGESIDAEIVVMDYEKAEELVHSHDKFGVAPCICRQEKDILGEPCEKPLETCMSFGSGADFYVRNGMGRYITKEEALGVLKLAEQTGLVVQPGAAKKATFICTCCGCCCGVLTNLKRHPKPAEIAHSAFFATHDEDLCDGCELCLDRCQMEALSLDDGIIYVDRDRCIGCGLCITTCPNDALALQRKPESELRPLPRTNVETHLQLGKTRGVLNYRQIAGMFIRSKRDRVLARNDQ